MAAAGGGAAAAPPARGWEPSETDSEIESLTGGGSVAGLSALSSEASVPEEEEGGAGRGIELVMLPPQSDASGLSFRTFLGGLEEAGGSVDEVVAEAVSQWQAAHGVAAGPHLPHISPRLATSPHI